MNTAPPFRTRRSVGLTYYYGSREQLIAASIIDVETPLPGDPGQRKSYLRFESHPRAIGIILRIPNGRYRVEVLDAAEEQADVECDREAATWARPALRLVWSDGRRLNGR